MAVHSSLSSPLGPPACETDAKPLQFIDEMTRNADAVQHTVLAEILSRNASTEYLRRYSLDGATDPQTFKAKLPVITYEDLQPEIQRIASGDRSPILSSHPISEFLTSSGTSAGERKLMPTIKEELDRRQLLYSLLMPVMNLYVPGLDKGKGLYFLFVKSETRTPGGLLARPVLTSYYKSDHFKTRPYDPFMVYTSPNEAILCPDSFQSMYTQMLCGLLQRNQVLRLGAVFASGLLRAIRFLQLNWHDLATDIRNGTLNSRITDPSLRDCILKILKPDSQLADFVSDECSKEDWEGIVTRIWPKTKYLDVIVTGAMAQYIPTLDFYSGGLPLACTMYASSECYFGLNLNPMCKPSEVSYTIMPNMAYFEFLPLEPNSGSDSSPKLVDLVDVEIGKEYELVITTYAGLYRYRVGDILRVTGFHNAAPQFHFVRRKNVVLSIDSDKTDEAELQKAVENASELLKEWKASVVEYTSYAETKTIPGHYVIYWELMVKEAGDQEGKGKWPSKEVMEECCLRMEESMNSVYRQGRVADHSIGALEIRVVKSGTFEELMDYAISRDKTRKEQRPICKSFHFSLSSHRFRFSQPYHFTLFLSHKSLPKDERYRYILCIPSFNSHMNSSMEIEQASSSSSSSSYPSSPVIQLGGRALDRHNPIICDGRRNITAPNTLLTPPREFSRPPFSPQPHHHQLTKSKKTSSKVNRKIKNKIPFVKHENEEKESSDNLPSTDILKKSSLIPTDIVTRSFAKLSDLVAPPPPPLVGSSRYLLESDTQSQYFDGLPEVDPVYDINPVDDYKELKTEANQDESTSSTTQPTLSQEPKPTPTKQVVVLMVSLHCKGCEGKVRKHLSKMEGVTSFKIDYAAKKVTIEGDVTPVGVLASVSKLKHAKFWTSQPPTPPPPPQSPVSTSLTVASTSATTEETPEKQL